MPAQYSGLKTLIDNLDANGLSSLGAMQVLFTLYDASRPMTANGIYGTGSGYRRAQLRHMCDIGLIKDPRRKSQNQTLVYSGSKASNAIATKGRNQLDRLMARESPNINERGHLQRWLRLIKLNGISSFAHLRLLVQIEETPGLCGRELFTYRSGTNNEQISRFQKLDLVSEILVNSRKEKYPGERWLMLRGYLNWPIPDSILHQTTL